MQTLIRTDDFPEAERFPRYREELSRLAIPVHLRCDDTTGFQARMSGATLGDLSVATRLTAAAGRCEVSRDSTLIRWYDPAAYRLVCNVGGRTRLEHAGHSTTLMPGTLALYDLSAPFTGARERHAPPDEWVMVTFPRALLPLPRRDVRRVLGRPLGHSGIGGLVFACTTELARNAGRFRNADAARLSAVFIDLLVALLSHELETPAADEPESRRRVLWLEVQAFVQRHLADPTLTPASIAAAHHISVRSLHRLFQDHGATVAAWIRERRLERCRRDLTDPRLADRPAHAIGHAWGFSDPAHFSRVFRAVHGLAPHAYREAAR